jgi:competence protein ComEA
MSAAAFLLLLAAAGLLARVLVGDGAPPGALLYRAADVPRPSRDSVSTKALQFGRPLSPGERIDVDRAAAQDLARLPRIGPALAARIVSDRELHGTFGSIEELDRVSGIGPVVLQGLRPHVAFSGRPPRGRSGTDFVRLNTASAEVLAQLRGIGPARAQEIIADRKRRGPFRTLDELARVRGIGPATVARLRGLAVP